MARPKAQASPSFKEKGEESRQVVVAQASFKEKGEESQNDARYHIAP